MFQRAGRPLRATINGRAVSLLRRTDRNVGLGALVSSASRTRFLLDPGDISRAVAPAVIHRAPAQRPRRPGARRHRRAHPVPRAQRPGCSASSSRRTARGSGCAPAGRSEGLEGLAQGGVIAPLAEYPERLAASPRRAVRARACVHAGRPRRPRRPGAGRRHRELLPAGEAPPPAGPCNSDVANDR
jgi:hypothetical protein